MFWTDMRNPVADAIDQHVEWERRRKLDHEANQSRGLDREWENLQRRMVLQAAGRPVTGGRVMDGQVSLPTPIGNVPAPWMREADPSRTLSYNGQSVEAYSPGELFAMKMQQDAIAKRMASVYKHQEIEAEARLKQRIARENQVPFEVAPGRPGQEFPFADTFGTGIQIPGLPSTPPRVAYVDPNQWLQHKDREATATARAQRGTSQSSTLRYFVDRANNRVVFGNQTESGFTQTGEMPLQDYRSRQGRSGASGSSHPAVAQAKANKAAAARENAFSALEKRRTSMQPAEFLAKKQEIQDRYEEAIAGLGLPYERVDFSQQASQTAKSAGNGPPTGARTATNPQTGEKVYWDGQAWRKY